MASAEKLPSGRYRGVYRDASGRKRFAGTFARKQDAREAAVDAEAKARRQSATTAGTLSARTTWGQWWELFNDGREFDSDTGRVEQAILKNYLLPRWRDVPLNQISHREVRLWVAELTKGRAPSYVQRIFSVFSVSITAAVDREILLASPTAGVRLPRRQKRPKPFISLDEAATLRGQLDPVYRDAVDFVLEVGIRPGELAGLHQHRVDLARGWLTVAETYVFLRKQIRAWPKDKEPRAIPLSGKAVEIVRRRLAGRERAVGCGVPHIDGAACRHDLVFRAKQGGVLNRDILNHHIRNAAAAAGLDPKSAYALRRGFATRLGEAGLDVFELQRLMGHSDINLTAEYVQQTAAARARVLAALGERAPLAVVERGTRGTDRGTDLDNQALPDVPGTGGEHAG